MLERRKSPKPTRIAFRFLGQLPSKSNYRFKARSKRKGRDPAWNRIVEAEKTIADLAREAWSKAGGTGPMFGRRREGTPWVIWECVNQKLDSNNASKILCDALEGICYENDREPGGMWYPAKDDPELPEYVNIAVEWRQ